MIEWFGHNVCLSGRFTLPEWSIDLPWSDAFYNQVHSSDGFRQMDGYRIPIYIHWATGGIPWYVDTN